MIKVKLNTIKTEILTTLVCKNLGKVINIKYKKKINFFYFFPYCPFFMYNSRGSVMPQRHDPAIIHKKNNSIKRKAIKL